MCRRPRGAGPAEGRQHGGGPSRRPGVHAQRSARTGSDVVLRRQEAGHFGGALLGALRHRVGQGDLDLAGGGGAARRGVHVRVQQRVRRGVHAELPSRQT